MKKNIQIKKYTNKFISNGMKKIIITFLILLSLSPNITNAEVTVWYYNEGPIPKIHSNFKTQVECENDRASFIKLNIGLTTDGMCRTTTVAGYPVPESEDAVSYIQPDPANGNIGVSENKTRYNFLVPIGSITCMDWGDSNVTRADGTKECIGNNIGEYLNIIFKIGIGLCAALAIIMLIIYGIIYMGDESIFGKTEAKKKMYGAIFGLIIALGAWALLNTINPALTGSGGIMFDSANISYEKSALMKNDPYTPGLVTSGCPEGIVTAKVEGIEMPVCKSMENDFKNMITEAKSKGINLSGYGYRSTETQIKLRIENCGGEANIYNASAKCTPLTALPGKSNHENGKAVDLKCDGVQIQTLDNKCYIWLSENAGKHGYINLKSEPWHWSIDGR